MKFATILTDRQTDSISLYFPYNIKRTDFAQVTNAVTLWGAVRELKEIKYSGFLSKPWAKEELAAALNINKE